MKYILLLISLLLVISCSEDDNETGDLSLTVTVGTVTDHNAIINWTVQGSSSPVTYEVVLEGQQIVNGYDGVQYDITGLTETTDYTGKVFAKGQDGSQTFANFSFTTLLDLSNDGDYVIDTQEKADNFYFTSISGNLLISGANISNLAGLSSLESVGSLSIQGTNLTSLEGLALQNLTGNTGEVYLNDNFSLEDVSDLSSFNTQIKTLHVINNISLVDLTGLDTAEEVLGLRIERSAVENLSIFNNMRISGGINLIDLPNLISITGFNNIESFTQTSQFRMENLPKLTTLNAFNSLISIAYNPLRIENLPSLESLQGFNSLITIEDGLIITDNFNLQIIDGFQSLETIDGYFFVENCKNLQDFGDFTSLTTITSEFYLEDLPSLTNINAFSQITSIGNLWQGINISNCENLVSLEGFSNLTNLHNLRLKDLDNLQSISALSNAYMSGNSKSISLTNLENLLSLSGLNNIQTLYSIQLDRLHSLTNLEGLNNLTEVEGSLSIVNMNNLNSVSGLENLTSVASDYSDAEYHAWITFHNLTQLYNFEGLSSLTFIGELMIRECPSLTSLSGFENVYQTFNGGAFYTIHDNSSLTDFCGLRLFANSNDPHPSSYDDISENAYNPTWEQIKSETECSQ